LYGNLGTPIGQSGVSIPELNNLEDVLQEAEKENCIEIKIYLKIIKIRLSLDEYENLKTILDLLDKAAFFLFESY